MTERFTETVSTGDVHDTLTGKSYRCEYRIDDEFLELVNNIAEENKELKASLYAEKTNTTEVVNDYAKQFRRHSAQFGFMMDLAEDLGVDIKSLEASDD